MEREKTTQPALSASKRKRCEEEEVLVVHQTRSFFTLTSQQLEELGRLEQEARKKKKERRALYRERSAAARNSSGGAVEWEQEGYSDEYLWKDYTVTNNAILVHSAHPLPLAGAVLHLIEHPEERRMMGEAGRKLVQAHFRPEDQLWKYANLYRFLAERGRGSN